MTLGLTACGGGDTESGSNSGSVSLVNSGYGIYVTESGYNVQLSKNGVLLLSQNNSASSTTGQGYQHFDISSSSANGVINFITNNGVLEANLSLVQLGKVSFEMVPFKLNIPDIGLNLNELAVYYKVEEPSHSIDVLDNEISYIGSGYSFEYISSGNVRYTDSDGCETEANVKESGLSTKQVAIFDLFVTDSTCEFNPNAVGMITYTEQLGYGGITLTHQLKDSIGQVTATSIL
ncbi:hypothetical protein VB10N_09170 [Vibrio sp. 10N]|nr:hypothetical protein VB10N_09170 [Vibrio sp. 10N]